MVKHSPNDRLRQLQLRQRAMDGANNIDVAADVHNPQEVLPPVDEALRRAAEVRAEADAQERETDPVLDGLHPNVNARRRRVPDAHDDDLDDDLGASFIGDGFPDTPPIWLSQVINAAVSAAATAVAAIPQRPAPAPAPVSYTHLTLPTIYPV